MVLMQIREINFCAHHKPGLIVLNARRPEWEQVQTVGAVCMNLTVAAAALGYASVWLTCWAAYDADAQAALGIQGEERLAGFIHIGTAKERPPGRHAQMPSHPATPAPRPQDLAQHSSLHRLYIGLVIGLELALVGFTGSLLVFHREIDAWLNPGLLTAQGAGTHQFINHVFAAARTPVPEAQRPSTKLGVQMPFRANATYLAWTKIPGETPQAERWQQVSLDPYSGGVLGAWEAEQDVVSLIYRLHYTLLLGEWGK